MNIQVVVLAIFAERKLKFCYKSWIFNEFLNNALLWKRRPSPPLLLINMNVQDHDYYDCVLSPALSFLCGSNLILDHIDCLRHWSHMGWGMMHFFSVSPGDVPFPWSHGGKYHSIKKFAQIWVVPFFTQKVYFFFFFFCPGDQFVSLLPSQLLNKSKVIEWVMFRVSACVNILVLAMQFSKMNSVLEGKTLWFWCILLNTWLVIGVPSSWGMLAILIAENLLWNFVILQKGNNVYLVQCDWLVNLW